ncbi:MAG: hypothetical protein HOP33_09135 [Verrucomicrobia bacterium]|nr:hypothetical protein [Verrucomicrobiota bacterium]
MITRLKLIFELAMMIGGSAFVLWARTLDRDSTGFANRPALVLRGGHPGNLLLRDARGAGGGALLRGQSETSNTKLQTPMNAGIISERGCVNDQPQHGAKNSNIGRAAAGDPHTAALRTNSEIRADMVNELLAAARTVESVAVFHPSMAATARAIAAEHRRQADQIEAKAEMLKQNFAESHNSTRLADESTAARVDFKLNGAASSSAPTFKMERAA